MRFCAAWLHLLRSVEREPADGVLPSANVPRAGLRPTLLLLFRYGQRPAGQIRAAEVTFGSGSLASPACLAHS